MIVLECIEADYGKKKAGLKNQQPPIAADVDQVSLAGGGLQFAT
jgi:hypothetical protein